MSFLDTILRAKAYLEQQDRVSLRALRREVALDEDALEELVDELVDVQQVAARDGKALAWVGATTARVQDEHATLIAGAARGSEATTAEVGERRQLTVLFCDLVGSTPLSQQLDAEEWRDVISRYQRAATEAVEKFGGHVAKNLGDGLLIYFGWPTAREDDPERAVRAGLAIVDAVRALKNPPVSPFFKGGEEAVPPLPKGSRRSPPFEKGGLGGISSDAAELHVRVGMHTGPVVIADGGEVFGETANVAARVQGAAEPDTVVITAATQRLVAGLFVVEDRGAQHLKGVREPVTLYRVVQPSGVRSRLAVAAGHLTRFVGRDMELGNARRSLGAGAGRRGAERRRPRRGGGREVAARLPAARAPGGRCPIRGWNAAPRRTRKGHAFHPVIALVSQGLAFAPEDTRGREARQARSRACATLASTENVALLADFLGLPPPTRLQLSPELQRRKTIDLLARWNLALSEVQPLVLFIEDLHWCDVSTLELLGHLIAQSPTARVLLARHGAPGLHAALAGALQPDHRAARPAHQAPGAGDGGTAGGQRTAGRDACPTRSKQEDPEEKSNGVAQASPPAHLIPNEVLEQIVARADGIPLYLEELTKTVLEAGTARSMEAIPASLADSLMARLDRLSTAKEVAQRAAVLGREFGYPLLAAMAGMDEAALRHGLGAPGRRGDRLRARRAARGHVHLQARADPGDGLPVAAQAHAPAAARARRPGAGGTLPRARASEPEVVARHYEQAGLVAQASTHYQRAGERATRRSANEEAIGHLRRALASGRARCRRRASAIRWSSGCRWRSGCRSPRSGDGRTRSTSGPTRAPASWRPRSASRPSCRECSWEWRRPTCEG